MHLPEVPADTPELDLSRRSDRVESPQQYDNWRDYAFSDAPEREDNGPH